MLGGLNLAREHGIDDGEPTWRMQVSLLEYLATRWQEPDDGLWEIRGDRQHFVHSKVLAWVAFDRMARTRRPPTRSTPRSASVDSTPYATPSPSTTARASWTRQRC